ncbi:MAG: hypothetical protein F6J87_21075 [Spirulina sp. SIO3F2]|nr:hypothetical protein [Spirulina sp. SIO3F2]
MYKEIKKYFFLFIAFSIIEIFQGLRYWNIVFIFTATWALIYASSKISGGINSSEEVSISEHLDDCEKSQTPNYTAPLLVSALGTLTGCFIRFEILGWS